MPAVPKPTRKPKSPRPPTRKSAPRKINPPRKKKRFEENFGGKAYRDYIVSLPCDICGVRGFSDPAHLKARGAGGKADVLAPLCHTRPTTERIGDYALLFSSRIGCHQHYDEYPWMIPEGTEERLLAKAAERRAAWLVVSGGDAKGDGE